MKSLFLAIVLMGSYANAKSVLVFDHRQKTQEVLEVTSESYGFLRLADGTQVHSSDVKQEVANYNGLSAGQTAQMDHYVAGGLYRQQMVRILHVFESGEAQVIMLENGGYAKGYVLIVPISDLN